MPGTRRSFLQQSGIALGAALGLLRGSSTLAAATDHDHAGWQVARTPTGVNLTDVVHAQDTTVAVGGSGVVLTREPSGWQITVEGGPTGNGANLHGVDVTADGHTVWFAGASGAVGEYDLTADTVTSHAAPDSVTNTFTDVAVTGDGPDPNVYIADASGTVHVSFAGEQGWHHVTPGSGAEIQALDFFGARAGILVDSNQTVFATTDGRTWTEIGVQDADHGLYGLDAESGTVRLAGGGGAIYERASHDWRVVTPTGKTMQDIAVGMCGCVTAVGGGGTIVHKHGSHGMDGDHSNPRQGWELQSTPTGENLAAITMGRPHIAVGASGMILERTCRRKDSNSKELN